ncbi:hypothetical protein BsWGS_10105 [Bradybaena similaris]
MPTYAEVGREHLSHDVLLIRECSTHNVRSATMADPSAAVATFNIGRMSLLFVLVWGYCWTGCVGVLYRPAAFSKTPESTGSLHGISQISGNEISNSKFSPSRATVVEAFWWADKRLNTKSSRLGHRNHDRESSLKRLLENLTILRQRHVTGRSKEDSRSASATDIDRTNKQYDLQDISVGLLFPQTQYQYEPRASFRIWSNIPVETGELQVVSDIDAIESSREIYTQTPPTERKTQPHKQTFTANVFSSLDKTGTILNSDVLAGIRTHPEDGDVNKKASEHTQAEMTKDIEDETWKRESAVYRDNYPRYFIVPGNLVTPASDNDIVSVKNTVNDETVEHCNDDSDSSEDIPFKAVQASPKSVDKTTRRTSSTNTPIEEARKNKQALLVDSLIHKTVKKMEGIINKRVSQFNEVFDTDEAKTSGDISISRRDQNTDKDGSYVRSKVYISTSLEKAGSVNHVTGEDQLEDNNPVHKRRSETHLENDDVNDVTAAVIKAVASRTVPRDVQFWMNVSTYLDSSDYLSRTRRSPSRSRKRNGPQYVHLSITYGHVMPCEHKDRFYCMSGGTCVFVGALDIKTCRCPIGYTGVRCELIDQEYILSLLTNTLIFS